MKNRTFFRLITPILTSLFVCFLHSPSTHAQSNGSEKLYKIDIKTQKKTKQAFATIKITGRAGYHCNTLYPWKLIIKEGGKETRTMTKQEASHFTKDNVTFVVPYLKADGNEATLKLSMCNDKQCIMENASISW
jgi:hypothetical protein